MAKPDKKTSKVAGKKDDHKAAPSAPAVSWADAPAEHDYPAAVSYLRLLVAEDEAQQLAKLLAEAETVHQHVKDVLRAARLPLLPGTDPEVAKDLAKVAAGIALSPVLLVRGDLAAGRQLQVADGFHRICASYHLSENTVIPCRLVSLPATTG
jgi:hypothetical protein